VAEIYDSIEEVQFQMRRVMDEAAVLGEDLGDLKFMQM